MNQRLKLVVEAMSLLVLGLYVVTFALVAIDAVWPDGIAKFAGALKGNEALAYVWSAVSVLVGAVVAVAYGQPVPRQAEGGLGPELIIFIYAIAFVAVGCAALAAWIAIASRLPPAETPPMIKNAVTAFFGLMVPIVTAYLRLPTDPGGGVRAEQAQRS